MKTIILCTQLEGGGAQRASFRLSTEMRHRGYEVENWFLYKKRSNFEGIGPTKVIQEFPIRSVADYLSISIKYYQMLRRERPDAVIAFTHYANVLGLFIAYLAGVKIRVASHRNPSWGDMSRVLMRIDNLLAKTKVYTRITAVSRSTKQSFTYYPEEIFQSVMVINNGLELQAPPQTKEEARRILNLPEQLPLVGTIGRLSAQKNQRMLINAVAKSSSLHLIIAGEGELREEITELIKSLNLCDRVILLGELPYNQIPLFLKSLDIYVMPSLFEGLSNALVEAMAARLPIISSDIDAQKDVLVDENGLNCGVLVPADDIDTWASEMEKLSKNPSLREKFSELAYTRSKDFSVKKMADRFVESLNSK